MHTGTLGEGERVVELALDLSDVAGKSRVQYYLAQAKLVRKLAKTVATASARDHFELLAVQYEQLAAQVAALEKFSKRH
jgi:hypothetical protein